MDLSSDQKLGSSAGQLPSKARSGAVIGVGILLGTLVLWGGCQGLLLWLVESPRNGLLAGGIGLGAQAALSRIEGVLLVANGLFSVLALAGVVGGLLYLKRQFEWQHAAFEALRQAQTQQASLIHGQLSKLESEWNRQRAQDEAMAEPQLNSKGGDTSGNIKRVEFENAGATVMQLSVQCETPGFFAELQPRLVLRASDCGHLKIVGCDGRTDVDVALIISYVTHHGKRGSKHYVVPASNHALLEAAHSA